jgi:hypothetical protein
VRRLQNRNSSGAISGAILPSVPSTRFTRDSIIGVAQQGDYLRQRQHARRSALQLWLVVSHPAQSAPDRRNHSQDATYPCLHPVHIHQELFDEVQSLLQRRSGHRRKRQVSLAPLADTLFDALRHRMAATHPRGHGAGATATRISPAPASDRKGVLRRVFATALGDYDQAAARVKQAAVDRLAGPRPVPEEGRAASRGGGRRRFSPADTPNWVASAQERCAGDESGVLRIASPMKVQTHGGRPIADRLLDTSLEELS